MPANLPVTKPHRAGLKFRSHERICSTVGSCSWKIFQPTQGFFCGPFDGSMGQRRSSRNRMAWSVRLAFIVLPVVIYVLLRKRLAALTDGPQSGFCFPWRRVPRIRT